MSEAVICPSCGRPAASSMTRYGIRHSCCGMNSWDGAPLASRETHRARKEAHDAFDPLWKSKRVTRSKAYELLAAELGLSSAECHMKIMDEATAKQVPAAVARIEERL